MKTLTLAVVSTILLSGTVLPVLAEQTATNDKAKSEIVETANVKVPGLRFFRANKKLALKGGTEAVSESKQTQSTTDLNYNDTDNFPTW